jgi:putative transposase
MAGAARKAYPTDLTDAQLELMEVVFPDPKPGGRSRAVELREVVSAVVTSTAAASIGTCSQYHLPPKSTIDEHFVAWRNGPSGP